MLHELLLPMFVHVLLLASLYVLLTIARAPAMGCGTKSGRRESISRIRAAHQCEPEKSV
jgi:hypothetical protein